MRLDSVILQLLVGTAFAGAALYQLKTGTILMKSDKPQSRHHRPAAFWLRIAICTVLAVACYLDAWLMVANKS